MQSRSALVKDVMADYGAATRGLLFDYLPDAEPRHYLYDLVADYPNRGGRGLRPTLCIATARAFGASLDEALHSAVAIELLHNALLVHDDIEDESDVRRGKPTLHAQHGVPIAINAGDMLTLLSLRPLLHNVERLGPYISMRILEETGRMARESAEGQALELGWRRDNTLALRDDDYLEMVLKKTCWLGTIHPTRIGALIATRDSVDLDAFIRFGFFVGAAFQITDDVLNLIGNEQSYGKELDGDIREGKRTLMMIHLLRVAKSDERQRLVTILAGARYQRSDDDVRWVRERMT
ncbi:MAG TPA: polyprenyl synthetase family protein, partial [Sorangium sp.]|nr:polyprenyl synthetase family protein [Sorangium sp.]